MSTHDAPGDPNQKPRNGQTGVLKSPGETGTVKSPDREGGQRKTDREGGQRKTSREAKLAAALRANLRRRKAPQVRGRAEEE